MKKFLMKYVVSVIMAVIWFTVGWLAKKANVLKTIIKENDKIDDELESKGIKFTPDDKSFTDETKEMLAKMEPEEKNKLLGEAAILTERQEAILKLADSI